MRCRTLSLAAFLASQALAQAPTPTPAPRAPVEYSAEVVNVIDGDIVNVRIGFRGVEAVRLIGIDAPEVRQPYGSEATAAAESLVKGMVILRVYGQDPWGRRVVDMRLKDGRNVSQELVRLGAAWRYKDAADKVIAALEAEARSRKIGLWASAGAPMAPWDFREHPPVIGEMEPISDRARNKLGRLQRQDDQHAKFNARRRSPMRSIGATALLVLALSGSAAPPSPSAEVAAEVVKVLDGDTIVLRISGRESETVLLRGIDAPDFPHLKAPALRARLGTGINLDADEFALKLFLSKRRA